MVVPKQKSFHKKMHLQIVDSGFRHNLLTEPIFNTSKSCAKWHTIFEAFT